MVLFSKFELDYKHVKLPNTNDPEFLENLKKALGELNESIETAEIIWNIIFMIYYVNLLSDNNAFVKNIDRFLFLCLDLD